MANAEESIGRKFISLADSIRWKENHVIYPGHSKATDTPLFSGGYANCNGVVLMRGGFGVMSHYDKKRKQPERYLPEMIEELERISATGYMTAVLMGGDEDHFKANEEILRKAGARIVVWYVDGWRDDELLLTDEIFRPPSQLTKSHKQLVAIPTDQEVIMYSDVTGFKILASSPSN